MVDSNHSISDLIKQPEDLSPIKITKTVSNVSLTQHMTGGMPPVETSEPNSTPPVEIMSEPSAPTKDVNASVERLDISQEPLVKLREKCRTFFTVKHLGRNDSDFR